MMLCALIVAHGSACAQWLPNSATPRGVVVAFMTETSSATADVDRSLFRERFTGELSGADPALYSGTVANGARVRIDSIPDLATADGVRRAVAFVTVTGRDDAENCYLFMRRDSIWRIEAIRRLVPQAQRAQIRAAARTLDTSVASFKLRRADLEHLLMPDDSLGALLRRFATHAAKVVATLSGVTRWTRFALRDVDLDTVDEYRELDNDVPPGEVIFYQVDRRSLDRLKRGLGVRRIQRDQRFPGLIFFEGAIIDRSHYGYIYNHGGAPLPSLSSEDFIVVRPVSRDWWLYKRVVR